MRKEARIFSILCVLLIASMLIVSAEDAIMKISSPSNAHGQLGNLVQVTECVGSAASCVNFHSDTSCEAQAGCEWDTSLIVGRCMSSYCDSLGETICKSTSGCSWQKPKLFTSGYCYGYIATACDAFGSSASCSAQTGCSWMDNIYSEIISYNSIYGWDFLAPGAYSGNTAIRISDTTNAHAQIPADVCSGIPASCTEQDETACGAMDGCTWVVKFFGLLSTCVNDCVAYENDQVSCEANSKCTWNSEDEECSGGGPPACEDVLDSTGCGNQVGCTWQDVDPTDYGTDVRFGDLDCRAKDINEGDCNKPGEKCVVKLSDWSNAHLEACDQSNYPIQICCKSERDYTQITNKGDCHVAGGIWTPPTAETSADGGGCCPQDKPLWDGFGCVANFDTPCTSAWTPTIAANLITLSKEDIQQLIRKNPTTGRYQYCAQVTSGIDYGIWYDIDSY